MKKIAVVCAVLALAGNLFAADLAGTWIFGGSTTVAPIAHAAIEAFTKANPNVKISYEAPGSSVGIKNLAAGTYSLAGSSRELKAEEEADGLVATPVGLDGLALVVNKSVKIANLSLEQVAGIYTGKITNWKEVGGVDAKVVVVNRDEASGTYASFWELACEKTAGKKIAFTKEAIVAKENGEVAVKVATTPNSIGYVGMAFIEEVEKQGGKSVAIGGVAPTIANVVAKKYGLARSLFLITKGQPAAGSIQKAFIDYVLSPKGQAIVKSADFIPLPKK